MQFESNNIRQDRQLDKEGWLMDEVLKTVKADVGKIYNVVDNGEEFLGIVTHDYPFYFVLESVTTKEWFKRTVSKVDIFTGAASMKLAQ